MMRLLRRSVFHAGLLPVTTPGAFLLSVLVFGSLNVDLTTYSSRLPRAGETLFGSAYRLSPGGKGANQAVAAARMGAATQMFGRVGQDAFGAQALQALQQNGVDVRGVVRDPHHATGLAVISVDQQAQNAIVVVSGANMAVGRSDVQRAAGALAGVRVLLLQLEVPLEASFTLARAARRRGVTVVLDPAPACELPAEFLSLVDVLTPNEVEAAQLVGFDVDGLQRAAQAAQELLARGARSVVIKLGAQGAYLAAGDIRRPIPPFAVQAVDTVAAGDAFNGALAAALVAGQGLPPAVRWGAAAGALAVTRQGAIPAMPSREDVFQLLEGRLP